MSNTYPNEPITIRSARASDRPQLERLAQRDSRVAPAGRLLVAETDGAIRAALSLDTGAVVADPFHPTRALVDLLRTRAAQTPTGTRRLRIVANSPAALETRAA
jgi:hypothetical protein